VDEFSGRAWLQVNAVRVGLVSRVVNLDAVFAGDGEQLIGRIETNVGHLKKSEQMRSANTYNCSKLLKNGHYYLKFGNLA